MTPPAQFWNWFIHREPELFNFNATHESEREAIFSEIASQLHKVDPDLTFEIGPNGQRKREFIISAGGIKRAFPAVVSLVGAAPTPGDGRSRPSGPVAVPLVLWRLEGSVLIQGMFSSRCVITEKWLDSTCLFPTFERKIWTLNRLVIYCSMRRWGNMTWNPGSV